MDKQTKVDARLPGDCVPGHRPRVAGRHKAAEHPKERLRRDGGHAIHAQGAPASENRILSAQRPRPYGGAEELLLGGEPREVFNLQSLTLAAGGPNDLLDNGPVDAVRGTECVGLAIPSSRFRLAQSYFR